MSKNQSKREVRAFFLRKIKDKIERIKRGDLTPEERNIEMAKIAIDQKIQLEQTAKESAARARRRKRQAEKRAERRAGERRAGEIKTLSRIRSRPTVHNKPGEWGDLVTRAWEGFGALPYAWEALKAILIAYRREDRLCPECMRKFGDRYIAQECFSENDIWEAGLSSAEGIRANIATLPGDNRINGYPTLPEFELKSKGGHDNKPRNKNLEQGCHIFPGEEVLQLPGGAPAVSQLAIRAGLDGESLDDVPLLTVKHSPSGLLLPRVVCRKCHNQKARPKADDVRTAKALLAERSAAKEFRLKQFEASLAELDALNQTENT